MTFSAAELVDLMRAAGEPTRLRILALLRNGELSVMELGQILDQSQPRVSRHLKLLAESGLVERFPDGAWVFYRLPIAGDVRAWLDESLGRLTAAEPQLARDLDRLGAVHRDRATEAAAYFERNAGRWDEIRSLYVDEAVVEAAILAAVGPGPFDRLIDLGTGSGRMLTLLGPRARSALGLDLSQQMLNLARRHVGEAALPQVELRHGDIFLTGLPSGSADLVVIHRVLHFLADPAAAVVEACRLAGEGGRLVIVDFAPHDHEYLRLAHQHRRLGFSDQEIARWCEDGGLQRMAAQALPPNDAEGLTVKIWSAEPEAGRRRSTTRTAA